MLALNNDYGQIRPLPHDRGLSDIRHMHHAAPLTATIGLYLAERTARGELAPKTRRGLYHSLTQFARSIGDPDVTRVTRRHIERWQEGLSVSGRTRRNYFVHVRTFFRYSADRGWIPRSPCDGMKAPTYRRQVPRHLTGIEIVHLFDGCRHSRDRVILTLMLQLGLRCVEVSGLEWEDIDPHHMTVLIRGKAGHERVLPLTTAAWSAIETYHLDVRVTRSGPVVRSLTDDRQGLLAETVSYEMSNLFKLTGVRRAAWDGKSAHAARHTMAGDILHRGAHLRDVQRILGHQSLTTTQMYLPLMVNDLRETLEGRRYGSTA